MDTKKLHIPKKKWLTYLALGLLFVFLISTFRAEIGSIFHTASHILTGSDYTHVHENQEESYNQLSPHSNHDHKILAFLHLMDKPTDLPIHSNTLHSINLDLLEYPVMQLGFYSLQSDKNTFLSSNISHWHSPVHLDILTPPPKV